MPEIEIRMIDFGPRKLKQELHVDVQFMLEYNGYPITWEEGCKTIKLATATKKRLWNKFIEVMPAHWETARKRLDSPPRKVHCLTQHIAYSITFTIT